MNRARTVLAAIAAAVLVGGGAAIAGCGNEEQNDYVEQVNEIQLAYLDDVTALVAEQPASNPKAIGELAADLAGLTEDVATEIDAVDPPDEVGDLHEQLVTALRDVAGQIDEAGETLASGDPQEVAKAATELQNATTAVQEELNTVIDQINAELGE